MTTPSTVADIVAALLADPELDPAKCRHVVSSLRSLVSYLGRDLTMPANFAAISRAMEQFDPLIAGISRKRWANIRADASWALRRYSASLRAPLPKELVPAWRTLRDALVDVALVRGLSRFIHWCNRTGIRPEEVDDAAMALFHKHLKTESLEKKPNRIYQRTCKLWNRAAEEVPGWPKTVVRIPSYRNIVKLPLDIFLPSFLADLALWEAAVSHRGQGLFSDRAPMRALRPRTIHHRREGFLRFASVLVRLRKAPETITGLSALVEIEAFKAGLTYLYQRAGGRTIPSLEELAGGLVGLARHWVKVSPEHLAELEACLESLRCRKRGMTEKNLERLRQFDDLRKQAALINLPEWLVAKARKVTNPKKAALLVQSALAIEIELMAPIRLANLMSLDIQRHFTFGQGRRTAHLFIPASEVKNEKDLTFELPARTVRLLNLYLSTYRPVLVTKPGESWLFPGVAAGHKHAVSLSGQVCKAIARYAGLTMNVHLFRHLAAKIFLDEHPGEYETVRQLLGHKNIQTTITFYCAFDTARAIKRHDEIVLKLASGRPLRIKKVA